MSIDKLIKKNIVTIPNFPKKGIMFRDITSLLSNKYTFQKVINESCKLASDRKISKVVGIDSRGFIFASAIAYKLKLPLILIRKKNKLPGETYSAKYALEYGTDALEIKKNSIEKKDKVMIVDDLIATGGTSLAAASLIKKTNTKKIFFLFLIELIELGGVKKLKNHDIISLSSYHENEQ